MCCLKLILRHSHENSEENDEYVIQDSEAEILTGYFPNERPDRCPYASLLDTAQGNLRFGCVVRDCDLSQPSK
jgi:hypothetical protein